MKRNTILIFSIAALALSACGDDDGNTPTTDGGNDSSTQPDSTINTPDGSTEDDASTTDNRTRECGMYGPALRAVWDEPRCEAATQECIENCDGDTQQEIVECATACIDADETDPKMNGNLTVDCEFCLTYEVFRCYYENGCDTQMANFGCCLQDKCADVAADQQQACAQAMCATEGQAQNVCFQSQGATCAGADSTCYPGVAGDGGAGDGGADASADAGADAGA